jgi:hypothetical protein
MEDEREKNDRDRQRNPACRAIDGANFGEHTGRGSGSRNGRACVGSASCAAQIRSGDYWTGSICSGLEAGEHIGLRQLRWCVVSEER